MPEDLWIEGHNTVSQAVIKTIPKKKKCKKSTQVSAEPLQIAEKEERLKAKDKRKNIPI